MGEYENMQRQKAEIRQRRAARGTPAPSEETGAMLVRWARGYALAIEGRKTVRIVASELVSGLRGLADRLTEAERERDEARAGWTEYETRAGADFDAMQEHCERIRKVKVAAEARCRELEAARDEARAAAMQAVLVAEAYRDWITERVLPIPPRSEGQRDLTEYDGELADVRALLAAPVAP